MQEIFLLLLGLGGLWIGTEFVISGAVKIADYFELSHVFVGIAILTIGTNLPEMVISANAAYQKSFHGIDTSGIIIGNSIGSCFGQISIVLGIAGLLGFLTLSKQHIFEDGIMMLGSKLVL